MQTDVYSHIKIIHPADIRPVVLCARAYVGVLILCIAFKLDQVLSQENNATVRQR
jgi:hypothetical protein